MNRRLVFLLTISAAIVVIAPSSSAAQLHASHAGTTAETSLAAETSLPTWRNLYDWSASGQGYVGWHSSTTASDDYGMQSALGDQYGLWLWPLGGKKTYDTTDYAQWTYTAPGTTRLKAVTLSYAWTNKLLAHHCIDVGFLDASGNVVTRREACKPPPQSPLEITLTDPSDNPTSNVLYFRIDVDCGGASSCSKTIPEKDPLKNGPYARLLEADMTLVDDDNPVVTPSGPFYDLRFQYIDGRQTYSLTTSADDAGAGIVRAWAERLVSGEILSSDAPCDPTHNTEVLDSRICPKAYSFNGDVDTNVLHEGLNTFLERAVDPAGNVGSSATWDIYVDRTAPNPASGFELLYFVPSTGELSITWSEATDPDLPGGVRGSGVAEQLYRIRRSGGDWTSWEHATGSGLELDDAVTGETIEVEVQTWDLVGNGPTLVSAVITAEPKAYPAGPIPEGDDSTPPEGEEIPPPDDVEFPPASDGPMGGPGALLRAALAILPTGITADARVQQEMRHLTTYGVADAGPGKTYTYHRKRAIAYAYEWHSRDKTNPYFHDYNWKGYNCTNFTSQILYVGGWPMNGLDGREKQHSNIWWSANDFRARASRNWTSYTFAGAPNFKQFMLTYDRGRVVWRGWNPDRNVSDWINKIEPGDLVIADLEAKPGERLLASHNMFVTTVRPGKKFVGLTYHGANNPADRNFFDIVRRYRHPDPDDPDGFYWIVRITNSGPEPDEAFYWPDYKHL